MTMKIYEVPLDYTTHGHMYIEAEHEEQAIGYAHQLLDGGGASVRIDHDGQAMIDSYRLYRPIREADSTSQEIKDDADAHAEALADMEV